MELEGSVLSSLRHCTSACCQPNLSVGELDLHLGTITCAGGGHRRYKCRSIDTDYQSNCITFTVFINTNLFVMRALSAQNQSAVYGTENFITSGSLAFPVSFFLLLARAYACHQVYPEASLALLLDHIPPPSPPSPHPKQVSFLCAVAEIAIMVVAGIRVIKAATSPQLV